MKPTWVFNDTHIGVRRTAGTTPESAKALRQAILTNFEVLLEGVDDGEDVILNGDLTDRFDIDLTDAFDLLEVLHAFLKRNPDSRLFIATGNHDLSRDSTKLGAVQFLASLLAMTHGNVSLVCNPCTIDGAIHVIPHMVNQAQFDLALDRVPEGAKYVLMHCNWDSPFAEHADHSLNLSRERAKALIERGHTLILGHEHHPREAFGGKLIVTGCQFPTSIADCVTAEGREVKSLSCVLLDGAGVIRNDTWSRHHKTGFRPLHIEDLLERGTAEYADFKGFIRVTGEVEAAQAADALRAISRLRQVSSAFVIGNAVKVRAGTADEIEDALEGVEDVRRVDVIAMLLESLTPEQQEAVKAVMTLKEEK